MFGKGILGINARNLLYVGRYNQKKTVMLADDKIRTKHFLSAREIPVPKLYSIIKNRDELDKFDFNNLPNHFVLKPNFSSGGEGIIVISDRKEGGFIGVNGEMYSRNDLYNHVSDILDGRFSIYGKDFAFFEQLVISDPSIGDFSFEGLPDIRVVVYNLIPVMAMLRLPTKRSSGKANLHLGACGVGIDMAKGEATYVTQNNKIVEEVPGFGPIKGLKIPYWEDILNIASKIQLVTNLGYLACDVAIDKSSGPVVLEINARAGLQVQVANLSPLRKRLEKVKGIKVTSVEKGVRVAKDMFGNVVVKGIENVSGKKLIGNEESVEVMYKDQTFKINALIDNSIERTVLDEDFAKKNKLIEDESYNDEKSIMKLKFNLAGERSQTVVDIEKVVSEKHQMIIGRRDLNNFLIDPSKKEEVAVLPKKDDSKPEQKEKKEYNIPVKKINFQYLDKLLVKIDSQIKLLYYLRPLNLLEEKKKFLKDTSYNPQFYYPEIKFDPFKLRSDLLKLEFDDSPLGQIFEKKKDEILQKIELLENIGTPMFNDISKDLYGDVEEELLKEAFKSIEKKVEPKKQKQYKADFAKKMFEEIFKKYKIKWRVKIKEGVVASAIAGKHNTLFVNKDAKFSEDHIKKLIVHEIETHVLTAQNGKTQPYEIFNRGLANYVETQEGLAVYNQNSLLKDPESANYYNAAVSYIAVHLAKELSFSKVFGKLKEMGIPDDRAFRVTTKVKRGLYDTEEKGGFTKDIVYFKGAKDIERFVDAGGDLKDLYYGKYSLEDLDLVKQVPYLRPPKFLPKWLKD